MSILKIIECFSLICQKVKYWALNIQLQALFLLPHHGTVAFRFLNEMFICLRLSLLHSMHYNEQLSLMLKTFDILIKVKISFRFDDEVPTSIQVYLLCISLITHCNVILNLSTFCTPIFFIRSGEGGRYSHITLNIEGGLLKICGQLQYV